MLQGMERWHPTGVTGNGTDRKREQVGRLHTAVADLGSNVSIDERTGLGGLHSKNRSHSLPTGAQLQTEYLDSLRALAYSIAQQKQASGGDAANTWSESGVTRRRSTTMIDTHRNRMDSELTSDSDHTFDHSSSLNTEPGEVFSRPATDEEREKILNSRLQELDSAQRSWKKRVADYVHGLPVSKALPGDGTRLQDPKRRRLWSTGCERLPWEIKSSDGVVPTSRRRITTVSSDSTFSCSQLSTSSSRDSIQYWVDSIEGLDAPDTAPESGHTRDDVKRTDSSGNPPTTRKVSDHGQGCPKPGPGNVDDDLGLGADAGSVSGPIQDAGFKQEQATGPGDKILERRLTNSDIINMAAQTKALQSRRKQLQRMGSSAISDSSIASQSVSDLLFARNDPEELLLNLGFGGGKEANPLDRIPARFLQHPSSAQGISINNFVMLCERQDQRLGFSLHGGLRGLGAVLQNSVSSLPTLPQHLNDFPSVSEEDHISSVLPGDQEHLLGPVEGIQNASIDQEWSATHNKDVQRSDGKLSVIPQVSLDLDKNPLRQENGFEAHQDASSRTKFVPDNLPSDKYASTDAPLSLNDAVGSKPSEDVSSSCTLEENRTLGDASCSSGMSDSSDSDWDYEEVDPGGGGLKSLEDHRRIRNARMIILEPLLPPVDEEQEVTPVSQAQQHRESLASDVITGLKLFTKDTEESPQPAEDCIAKKPAESCLDEKKAASLTPERAAFHLTHKQESFEIEEISSTENQDDGSAASKTSEKVPEKGPLVRTDSAQSDSSGFADEVMDVAVITNSPCMEDFHEQGSLHQDHNEGNSRPETGNKLIQTSFDDFGVLESFDWDEHTQDPDHGILDKPANEGSVEEEKSAQSENERNSPSRKSSISSSERIARSRKSFRDSRSSYERMGSTFSGISISALEDSPFDGDGPAVMVGNTPVPRQRSGTYPTVVEKQEIPPGPKTVVEILTTMQENIMQATKAKKLMEEENGASRVKKRPLLLKMKTVDLDLDCFSLDSFTAVGHAEQVPKALPKEKDTCINKHEEVSLENSNFPTVEVAENGIEDTGRSLSKLKRKPSQISMMPTLPCLDEEKTPAHSRHSSLTDAQNTALKQNSLPGYCGDMNDVPKDANTTSPANCTATADSQSENLDCADLLSDTDTPVSMVANVDSIGDVGDLEEEMKYLEHVERLLREEGKLLEEASPPRFRTRSRTEESVGTVPEQSVVQELAIDSHSSQVDCASSDRLDQVETTNQFSLLELDPSFQNHSGARLSLSDADDNADHANATVIPNLCSTEPNSSHSPELVESSVCLYLSPPPFVIDFATVSSSSAQTKNIFHSEYLCNFHVSELPEERYRTSLEMALDGESADKSIRKISGNSTESITRVKPEDDLQDMKLIQRALFRYKQDLCELESLAERLYSRHLDEDGDEGAEGGMTERERAELDSVRGLREQVMHEVEVMEGQLAQRMAITRTNIEDSIQNSLPTCTSEDNLQVIQEMVKLLEEQRSLRRMLQDLETTHSCPSVSDSSTCPELSVVGSVDWEESDHREGAGDMTIMDKRDMMQALMDVRLELQRQREVARREMNSAVREMRQAIISELRQELQLDVQLFQRQLQAKDKEIEQLKTLLRHQRSLQDGE